MYIEPLKQQNIISDMDAQVLFNNWQIIVSVPRLPRCALRLWKLRESTEDPR
jgi:hypothetical protein